MVRHCINQIPNSYTFPSGLYAVSITKNNHTSEETDVLYSLGGHSIHKAADVRTTDGIKHSWRRYYWRLVALRAVDGVKRNTDVVDDEKRMSAGTMDRRSSGRAIAFWGASMVKTILPRLHEATRSDRWMKRDLDLNTWSEDVIWRPKCR